MRGEAVAPTIRARVLASCDRFWRPEDFDGSPAAVVQALHRLKADQELLRLRKGLYWRGRPTLLGMAPPSPAQIVRELVGAAGSGPAGASAVHLLHLSTQLPRREVIAVPRRAPSAPERMQFVSRAASSKRESERLSAAEVALLEVLRDWGKLVEVPDDEADRIVGDHIANGAIRPGKIARAADTEPPAVRTRLAALLARIGHTQEASAIRPARTKHAAVAL